MRFFTSLMSSALLTAALALTTACPAGEGEGEGEGQAGEGEGEGIAEGEGEGSFVPHVDEICDDDTDNDDDGQVDCADFECRDFAGCVSSEGEGEGAAEGEGEGAAEGEGEGAAEGEGEGEVVDPCAGDPCGPHGECSDEQIMVLRSGVSARSDFTCFCDEGYDGVPCERPRSCSEILASDELAESGIYTVDFDGLDALPEVDVECDMDFDGGGWTLVLSSAGFGVFDLDRRAPRSGDAARLTVDELLALAPSIEQVHVRTTFNAERSVTSRPGSMPAQNLRAGLALSGVGENFRSTDWTGSMVEHVPYFCQGVSNYPNVYQACNNGNGLHLTGSDSRWSFDEEFGNESLELWVRDAAVATSCDAFTSQEVFEPGEYFIDADGEGGEDGAYEFCTRCGNSTVDPEEECDDGNDVDDDACSNECSSNVIFETEPNDDGISQLYFHGALSTSHAYLGGQVVGDDGVDTWALRNPTSSQLTLRAQTFDASGVDCDGVDTVVTVLGTDGASVLGGNDNNGNSLCSLVTDIQIGPNQTYFVRVARNENNDDIGAYVLSVDLIGCGNGRIDGDEQCDDNNSTSDDGCSSECTDEAFGFACDAGETYIELNFSPDLTISDDTTQTTTATVNAPNMVVRRAMVRIDNLVHTFDGDLDISIAGPGTGFIDLSSDNGGSGENYIGTTFDSRCETDIANGASPFGGCFAPEGNLFDLRNLPASGDWTLSITDDFEDDTGTLNSWSLGLCVIESIIG